MKTTRLFIIVFICCLATVSMATDQLARNDENEFFRAPANIGMIDGMLDLNRDYIFIDTALWRGVVVIDEDYLIVEEDSVLWFYTLHVYQGNDVVLTLPLEQPVSPLFSSEVYFDLAGDTSIYDYIKLTPKQLFIHKTGFPEEDSIEDEDGTLHLPGIYIPLLDESAFYDYL